MEEKRRATKFCARAWGARRSLAGGNSRILLAAARRSDRRREGLLAAARFTRSRFASNAPNTRAGDGEAATKTQPRQNNSRPDLQRSHVRRHGWASVPA